MKDPYTSLSHVHRGLEEVSKCEPHNTCYTINNKIEILFSQVSFADFHLFNIHNKNTYQISE